MYDPAAPALRVGEYQGQGLASGAKARFAEDRLLDAVIWCETQNTEAIAAIRLRLIDAQETFFMRQLLLSEAPLTYRSEHNPPHHQTNTTHNRREL